MSDVMLAEKWSEEDPTGWWISEKLDGVRAVWRNGEFVSRGDNSFACPEWFRRQMPNNCELDGELWSGRRHFQKTVGIVKSAARATEWEFITFMVFDALADGSVPIEHRPFEERLDAIQRFCIGSDALKPVPMQKCRGREHLLELLAKIELQGGEGLMLRRPGSVYEHRRSKSLLKVKTFHDEEARVTGHEPGHGRVAGMCGALLCETPDKRCFKVGSGLSDTQRRHPPKVGSVITYRYQELTIANLPRYPTLVGERTDLDWHRICAAYVAPGKRIETALKKQHTVLFGDDEGPAAPPPPRGVKRALSSEDMRQRGAPVEDLEDLLGEEVRSLDKRPVCAFGSKCYRRAPGHYVEFAHPWLDAENEEEPVLSDVSPTAPVGTAAAAGASPAMEAESDVRSIALRTLLSSLSKDGGSAEERAHFLRVLEFLDAGPRASKVVALEKSAPDASACEPLARGALVEEAPPPLPPPGEEPPTLSSRIPAPGGLSIPGSASAASSALAPSRPVPFADVLAADTHPPGATAVTVAPAAPTTTVAAPLAAPPPSGAAASDAVETLRSMGFAAPDVAEALAHCDGRADRAVDWLLAKGAG